MKIVFISLSLIIILLLAGCSLFFPGEITGYAMIYGVGDYSLNPGLNDLAGTVEDAYELAALLEAKGYTVYLRIDDGSAGVDIEPATLAQFSADIDAIASVISPSDNFIFYYSGHGHGTNTIGTNAGDSVYKESIILYNTYGPIATDLINADYTIARTHVLMDDDIETHLMKIPASKKLVMIDACKSGGFIQSSTNPSSDLINQSIMDPSNPIPGAISDSVAAFFTKASVNSGSIYVTAAGETENSQESVSLVNGFFTYFVLTMGSNGDFNNDKYISVNELYRYTSNCFVYDMNPAWNDILGYDYHPHISGNARDFILFSTE